MKAQIAALVASAPQRRPLYRLRRARRPTLLGDVERRSSAEIYTLFGLKNIADAADQTRARGYPQLSAEYIVGANPDLIVLADTRCCGQTPAKVAAAAGLVDDRPPSDRGAIVVIDDAIASRWGPRLVDFVNAVASALRTTQK